jgi:hypothetical protein
VSLEIDVIEPTEALNFAVIHIIGLFRPDSLLIIDLEWLIRWQGRTKIVIIVLSGFGCLLGW